MSAYHLPAAGDVGQQAIRTEINELDNALKLSNIVLWPGFLSCWINNLSPLQNNHVLGFKTNLLRPLNGA